MTSMWPVTGHCVSRLYKCVWPSLWLSTCLPQGWILVCTLLYSSSWLLHESCLWCLLSACSHAHSFLSCIEISMTYKQWETRQQWKQWEKRANSMGGRGYCSNFTALEAPVRLVNVTLKRNKQWLVVATDREICIWRVPQQRPCYYNIFLGNVCSLRILSHQKNK